MGFTLLLASYLFLGITLARLSIVQSLCVTVLDLNHPVKALGDVEKVIKESALVNLIPCTMKSRSTKHAEEIGQVVPKVCWKRT